MGQLLTEKTFQTGTIELNYAEGPDQGPPVVLLHGGSADWHDFEDLGRLLRAHWHVYIPDLRGHGKSGRVPWGYSMREYAADIGAFLQQVSGPAALCGHSLGGVIAVTTASLYPGQIRALLVSDAPLDEVSWQAAMSKPSHREMQQNLRALSGGTYTKEEVIARLKTIPGDAPGSEGQVQTLGDLYPDGDPFYEYMARRLLGHDPDVLGMLLEDYRAVAAGYEMEKTLPAIQCPVLLMQADPTAGGALSDEEVARAMTMLKHGVHVKLTGLSHLYFWEDLLRVACEIDNFLEQFARPKQES
jgi:pimeloyl-ACP methyl ester carboxylesterase